MKRDRIRLLGLTVLLLMLLTGCAADYFLRKADQGLVGGPIVLDNAYYRIEVARPNGLISRLLDKAGNIEFINEPRLAGNFKFTLPLRGAAAWQSTEGNYILGEKQRLSGMLKNESSLQLTWAGPLTSVTGGSYDADVTMRIVLVEDRVEFRMTVNNRSDQKIGELFYPMLGGLLGLAPGAGGKAANPKETVLAAPVRNGIQPASIFKNFANHSWLGIFGPEQFYSYPKNLSMPWMDFYQPQLDHGVSFGALDPVFRFKVLHLEMFPGIAGNRKEGNWPRPDELNDSPAGVRISCVQMPYHPAHSVFEATPVFLQAHSGDWRTVAARYAKLATLPTPQATPLASLSSMPSSSGIPRCVLVCDGRPFEKLAEIARATAAHGFDSVLLNDWRDDKPGSGKPWFVPPADAGQREALKSGIAACHATGLRVFLGMDFERAQQQTKFYDTHLAPFACTDPWGILDTQVGWETGETHVARLASTERRVRLNPGSPGYRAALAAQAAELAELGADGVHIKRFFGRVLDFNPNVNATADRASWEGGLATLEAMTQAAQVSRPGFAISMDDACDRLIPLTFACGTSLSLQSAALREAYPGWRAITRVTSPDDYIAVSRAVLCNAVVQVEPAGGPQALARKEWTDLLAWYKKSAALLNGFGPRQEVPADKQTDKRVEGPAELYLCKDSAGKLRLVIFNNSSRMARITIRGFEGSETSGITLPLNLELQPGRFALVP